MTTALEDIGAEIKALRTENDRLRAALLPLMAQLIVAENGSSLNGNVTIPKQTLPASVYDAALKAATGAPEQRSDT